MLPRSEAPAEQAPAEEPAKGLQLHVPIDVRNASIALLALLASIYTLHWARAVFIPLLLAVIFSYALSPAVDKLQRWKVPRAAICALRFFSAFSVPDSTAWPKPSSW